MAGIIKKKKENFIKSLQEWKTGSRSSKQLLSNFQAENSCDRKQLKTEIKNGVAYNKYLHLRNGCQL